MTSGNDDNEKKRPEITIRQMEIDDISPVYHLGERLFTSDKYTILYRTWDPFEVTDAFTSDPDFCLVAEDDESEKIAGFILATTIEKEGTAWKKYGYVSWIGVDSGFQRLNLGHRLYRKLEERLKKEGVRMVIADTDAENKRAVAFFNAMEFNTSSEHIWLTKTLRRPGKKEEKP
jgi:ribosomal protein S18 acetylase RimI-like enzyme